VREIVLRIPGHPEISIAEGTSFLKVVQSLSATEGVLAVAVRDRAYDLSTPVEAAVRDGSADARLITFDTPEGKEIYRHSSAHLMAQAVKEVIPSAQMTIGPAIENGFYYDFDVTHPFTPEDLEAIELKMREIIARDLTIQRHELSKEDAQTLFRKRGEPYKVAIIDELDLPISVYSQGDFMDLCMGPHVPSTGVIRAVKLTHTAGAYWRGNENNKMLQRIYGTSFTTQEALEAHLSLIEEAKKRDHRKLGRELDLFSISESVGAGLILWHPNGAIIRQEIEDFWREAHRQAGYQFVYTPHVARRHLWAESGHLDFYCENMFSPMDVDGVPYQIKPMNCPFHIQIFKSRLRSYRDLPLRWAELGTVYRYERSGVLHGLLRVRGFTQDDAHLFCLPDQMDREIAAVLDFTTFVLGTFGFSEVEVYLSTRPEKYVGALEDWQIATSALENALIRRGLPYKIDPGEGVFYGPKIDIKIKDVLGRSWQCATIQVDFNLPERFDLTYCAEDGKQHRPIMVHRALLGSLERFFGILIEHYAGAFPLWLAPVQVQIVPIAERHRAYTASIDQSLRAKGIRSVLDDRNEKMGLKIREAHQKKIPYVLVAGDREQTEGTLSVRDRSGQSVTMTLPDLVGVLETHIANRKDGVAPSFSLSQ